jgi:hypothetical protein
MVVLTNFIQANRRLNNQAAPERVARAIAMSGKKSVRSWVKPAPSR